MQGLTFSKDQAKLYTAIADIRYGMEDNQKKGKNDTSYDIGERVGNNNKTYVMLW